MKTASSDHIFVSVLCQRVLWFRPVKFYTQQLLLPGRPTVLQACLHRPSPTVWSWWVMTRSSHPTNAARCSRRSNRWDLLVVQFSQFYNFSDMFNFKAVHDIIPSSVQVLILCVCSIFTGSLWNNMCMKIYGTVSSFSQSVISQLGGVALELSVEELSSLRLSERRSIAAMGAVSAWSKRQVSHRFTIVTAYIFGQILSKTRIWLLYLPS